jgi:two-component system phosphate regulon sensor histidine kinase PhoR
LKQKLFFRILFSYFVVILLVAAIVGFFFAKQVRLHETQKIEESLLNYERLVALLPIPDMAGQIVHLGHVAQARVTVIDAGGRVVADSQGDAPHMEDHINRPEVQEARIKGDGKAIRRSHTLQVDMLYVALVLRDGESVRGYVRMARSLQEVEHAVDRMYGSLYRAIGLALLPALLLAFLYTWKISRPVLEMRDYTRAIRRGELPGTLLVDSADELGQVAEDINYLVTEYREKIRLAHEEKGKLESALASMVEGVVILDSRNRIESCNQAIEAILERPEAEIREKTLLEAFLNADLQNALDRFRMERKPVLQEIRLGRKDPRVVDVSISAIRDLPDGVEKTMLVFHDVTRLKKLEQIRTDFVANVTHEIKTPLTAIIGFLQTLLDGALDDRETARKFLQTIATNAGTFKPACGRSADAFQYRTQRNESPS